jgi:protein TonB
MKNMIVIAALLIAPAAWAVTTPVLGPDDSGPLHVAQDIQSLRLITQVKPVYPELARLSRTEGAVILQVNITRDGSVSKVEIMSGPSLLTRAAQEAVRQWKYKPTVVNGQAVEVVTQVRVAFSISGK